MEERGVEYTNGLGHISSDMGFAGAGKRLVHSPAFDTFIPDQVTPTFQLEYGEILHCSGNTIKGMKKKKTSLSRIHLIASHGLWAV